jgi:hypothetical protein
MYEYFGRTQCLLFSENSKLTFVVCFYRNLFCQNSRRIPSNKFIQFKSYEKSEVHTCQEGTQEALNGRLGRSRTSLELSGVKINPSPMRGFETRTVQPVAFILFRSCYTATDPTVFKKRAWTRLDDYATGSRNNPDERNRHLFRGGSMKSRVKWGRYIFYLLPHNLLNNTLS